MTSIYDVTELTSTSDLTELTSTSDVTELTSPSAVPGSRRWTFCPCTRTRSSLQYVSSRYGQLCEVLEPLVGVKSKEDIATALVHVMQREGLAKHLLSDLVCMDVTRVGKREGGEGERGEGEEGGRGGEEREKLKRERGGEEEGVPPALMLRSLVTSPLPTLSKIPLCRVP